ncbi:ABC transporter ATP-binding protein [Niallia circulans]|uniref:ABC transporter permease n=1 Tax=Niallia TaxID=2837506 RepID=UPI00077C7833|nr:ABC transporter permease [Niallia circulans]MCM2981720.1 ABC transporter permease [Niallia circulans]MDR4316972.1 FtsX-like permease family protein [Niallia circulans]MED3837950.1 ABC transporter permease [Niallia circulans]MED4241719.1 ABC transporter permease [Niallia circulans]MED4247352.1 ABC transporter permease [Niallia circulans]
MKLGQAIKIAFKNIAMNKLRAVLTMLGIIIGVAAVIALTSLGMGASNSVSDDIASLGTTTVSVNLSGNSSEEEVVDYDELMAFAEYDEVKAVSPTVTTSSTLKNGTTSSSGVTVTGVTTSYEEVQDITLQSGRNVMDIDLDNRNKVVVLGDNVASELFGFTNPVDKTVQIDGTTFKVIGVLAEKGEELTGSVDDSVLIPFTTAQRFIGQTYVTSATVLMTDEDSVEMGMAKMKQELYNQFDGDETSYSVRNQSSVSEALDSVSNTMTLLLAGIASISLIVGGIGIMNIMLVSVTERTREIGIRKAIGARKKDIMLQFLIEAIVLSALGGILGAAIGIASADILSSTLEMTSQITWWIVGGSVSFSVLIGIIFGIFPANKASNLSPLEALRYQ